MNAFLLCPVLLLGWWVLHSDAAPFEIRNPEEFRKILPNGAGLQKLAGGFQSAEGPAWVPREDGYLIFSDVGANEMKKWVKAEGTTTFRTPSNHANGNTFDLEGRLLTAEQGTRRVSRTEMDGTVVTVVDRYNGKKLNSPDDLVVKGDGSIWFTDPDHGIKPEEKEQPGNLVFRYDPRTKQLSVMASDFDQPNGLCFSPDETKLYIADSGAPRHIRVFEVKEDCSLTNGRVFCQIDNGVPDGIRCDRAGRLYASAGDGIHIFSPEGTLLGKIFLPPAPGRKEPESPANLAFGGKNRTTLFITARTSLYSIELNTKGAQ